jgi:hypothetical protein
MGLLRLMPGAMPTVPAMAVVITIAINELDAHTTRPWVLLLLRLALVSLLLMFKMSIILQHLDVS